MTGASVPDQRSVHVLIIGAVVLVVRTTPELTNDLGITGLLIAHGLKKAGISFTIFESEPADHYRPREWSMGIHWALPSLEALLPTDLRARIKEVQNDPFLDHPEHDVLTVWNCIDGSILKELPLPHTIRVSRRKMRAFCCQGLDVKYGYELARTHFVEDGSGVLAYFKNGEEVSGTAIVGSDGPRSKVREMLLGEKAAITPMDVVHNNVAVVYNDAEKARFVRGAHPVFSLAVHPTVMAFLSIQDIPDPDDSTNWRFQVVISWSGRSDTSLDNAGRLAQLKEKAEVLCEPFRSAAAWIPDNTKITNNNISYWIPIPWDNHGGRATLAGDAAHPMPPHRGQGLNHAICDASNFVAAIENFVNGTASLKEAITDYSDEVVKRGATEVLISKEQCLSFFDWDKLMASTIMTRSLQRTDIPLPTESK